MGGDEDITTVLNGGTASAEDGRVARRVYEQLRALAASIVGDEPGGALGHGTDMNVTRVVHDAWVRLAATSVWQSRAHFFGAASRAVRQVLVSEARRRGVRRRRASDVARLYQLREGVAGADVLDAADLLGVSEVIDRLARTQERWARVAEMKVFGGMGDADIAACLDVSVRTVERDWRFCRACLAEWLSGDPGEDRSTDVGKGGASAHEGEHGRS